MLAQESDPYTVALLRNFAHFSSISLKRISAQQSLNVSQSNYKQQNEILNVLLDNLSGGVFMVEAPSGKPIYANKAAQNILGRGILPDCTEENLAEVYKAYKYQSSQPYPLEEMPIVRGMNGESLHVDDMVVIHPNGEEILLDVYGAPICNEQGQVWASLVSFYDITERKQAELELRESEERFRALHDASFGGISIHEKGIILECNQGLSDMTGYALSELIGMNGLLLIAPEHRELVMHNIVTGYEKRYEANGLRKSGEIFPMRLEGRNIPYKGRTVRAVEFRDISEIKQAEIKLRERTDLLSMIMETSPVGIVTINKTGSITYANTRAEHILGLTKEEITSTTFDAPIWKHTDLDGSFLTDEKQPFNIVKKTMSTVYNMQHGITWPDGTVVLLSVNGSPLLDPDGNFNGMVATFDDITDSKKNETEIFKQLSEKEILLREVHHRVKNNIANIEGLLTLQANATASEEAKIALQDAVARVQSMRILYEKLLLSNDYQDISIKGYTENLIDSLLSAFAIQTNITIEKHITDFNICSKTAVAVGIIINELMTNVFKYAFTGRDSGIVLVSIDKTENRVTLIVKDNGIGIDEGVESNKTQGFGLTIVKMLATQLRGTYRIFNDNGTESILEFEI